MRSANLSISVISDGSFLLDGGSLFGQVPKVLWERGVKADRRNRVRLGLNCLLIQSPTKNILVDTGIGSKEPENVKDLYGLSCNKLLRGLKNVGLNARQIDMVILTHLHFDHAGGSTKIDRTGNAMPTFPKATYIVQRACWEEAINPSERGRASFHPNDFLPLEEKGQLTLIDGDCDVNARASRSLRTPLHEAVANNRDDLAQLLLKSGKCDLTLQGSDGNTAEGLAKERSLGKLIRLFDSS